MHETIPGEVRRFLLAAVPSIPHLEALLLMHADAGVCWDAAQLARRLYVDEGTATRVLADLGDAGLLRPQPEGCSYGPDDPHLCAVIDLLAQVYARQVVAVSELIHSSADRKAQRFADAFRLRKDT